MIDTKTAPLHYDRRTILLHWITAALVVSLWALGQTIDWFPKGNPRVFARSTHITLGIALALVLVARLPWRFGGGGKHRRPSGSHLNPSTGQTHCVAPQAGCACDMSPEPASDISTNASSRRRGPMQRLQFPQHSRPVGEEGSFIAAEHQMPRKRAEPVAMRNRTHDTTGSSNAVELPRRL